MIEHPPRGPLSPLEEKAYESVAQLKGSMSQKNLPDPSVVARASYLRVLDSYSPGPGVWS